MTKREAGQLVLNTALTVVGAIAVLVLSGAWSLKEDASAHQRDIYELRSLQQRTLDVVCALTKPEPRPCQP